MNGYVYLFGSPIRGCYKIGMSSRPEKRFKDIQSGVPFPIESICVFPVRDQVAVEKKLHAHFATKKLRHEWFRLTRADIEELITIAGTETIYTELRNEFLEEEEVHRERYNVESMRREHLGLPDDPDAIEEAIFHNYPD